MKKHLALFAAAFAIVLMASTAVAQDTTAAPTTPAATTTKKAKSGGAAANKAASELADLTKTLNLTDDQQAKIKPILADESSKLHGGKKAAATDDAKAKNKAVRDAANQQIRAILTPDQQKTFDSTSKKSKKAAAAAAPAA